MADAPNYYAFHKEIDEINRTLIKGVENKTVLDQYEKKVGRLVKQYVDDTGLGTQRYKLYQAQGLIFYLRFQDAQAADYIGQATDMYGETIPGMDKVMDDIAKGLRTAQQQVTKVPNKYPDVVLIKQTGLLLANQRQSFTYHGSPEQLRPYYYRVLGHNLLFGWWSLYSVLINPVVILLNWWRWQRHKRNCRGII